jgi:SAM-dependent methyltransferase
LLSSVANPIFSDKFWRSRLAQAIAAEQVHHAVYKCAPESWTAIMNRHREILREEIGPVDDVLDAGCGWGRLLNLLPTEWKGNYLGIDLSTDFINMARANYPGKEFICGDMRNVLAGLVRMGRHYDWAVLISIRQMIIDNAGDAFWDEIICLLKGCCSRVLILEYEEEDRGKVV